MTRLTRRRALLIGNENYDDGRFARLPSTQADIWQLKQVLEHRNIGAFLDVRSVADLSAEEMQVEIGTFLEGCDEDELALLYISGHGTRLVQSGGEFFFIAKDTDFERVAETGVSAGFVNEVLEQCVAPQKVVMIDCCRSGGFAVGLRTSDRQHAAKSGEKAPLTSRGVYVLSSSRAGEDSYAGAETLDGVQPSAFTAEVVEALRTGKVGKDGTGDVSVDALFEYVNRHMRAGQSKQIPVKSAYGVDDIIVMAGCPLGAAPRLVPLTRKPAGPTAPAGSQAPKATRSQPTWSDLLGYYRECVLSDQAEPSLMSVTDYGTSYVCLTGSERFLSGDLDNDHCATVPPEAAALIQAAEEQDAELWTGYPAVVLHRTRSGRQERTPRFAPMLMRRVEAVYEEGVVRLKPYGPVLPHPDLARQRLGAEGADELADTYQPTWHAGQHDRMAVDIRNLLTQEYELPNVQELEPDRLADRIDVDTPTDGARNAAVLFLTPRDPDVMTRGLLRDFADIAKKTEKIKVTALAALSPNPAERAEPSPERAPETVRLVTPLPCNEAQSAVLRAAMTRRLTVATGPPGTGKSQLVANLVATAVAAGQRVLVASTNNDAVDEVCRRCEGLTPGSIVRTGSSRHREIELAALNKLRAATVPERNVETARAHLDVVTEDLERERERLAYTARTERTLRQAGQAREEHAARLRLPVPDLAARLESVRHLDGLVRKAERAASARLLGEWRRGRLLRRYGIPPHPGATADACAALAGFADAEMTWQAERRQMAVGPDDHGLATSLATAESATRAASAALLDSAVRSAARNGKQLIDGLVRARDADGSDWPAVRAVLPAVRGWAVTSLSARRFPSDPALFDLVIIDEASQCAIPHVLPLLFRARRALIIGDLMQLAHITTIGSEREGLIRREAGLRSAWLEKYRLTFRRHSAFHAAERAAGGSLLLDEHFRCDPQIAAFANHQFYDGQLVVLTDVRNRPSLPERPAIVWSNVEGNAARPRSGGSWVNQEEVQRVVESVQYLLRQLPPDATVGVVTPYKAQAEAVKRQLGRDRERVRVGTVHTFQGGERDVMIFSLVAGQGMPDNSIRWVDRQLNMWNVAITRARSHLIVVGDSARWHSRGGVGAALRAAASAVDGDGLGEDGQKSGELMKRLFRSLSAGVSGGTVELGGTVNGHPVDALVRMDGRATAILLDPGPDEGTDEARHLRLMLRRRELLDGQDAAVRVPAWKLYGSNGTDAALIPGPR
ncbi:AAA domain-containing protein [Actinoallomurus sp. NPDC050550]|uniref:caspase, EACC1-associated type n=1 Tax=Actinoallomurus sp. NPDC050550 TaxID=3154937 RepID=UPI0033DDFB77